MRKTEKGGLILAVVGLADRALASLSNVSGVHADSPGLFKAAWHAMTGAFEFLGFSGIAIIVGVAMFVWGRWGERIARRFRLGGTAETTSEGPDAIREELDRLWRTVEEVSNSASELTKKSAEIQEVQTETRILRDILPRLNAVDHNIKNIDSKLSDMESNSRILLEYAVEDAAHQILSAVREREPKEIVSYHEQSEITEQWVEGQTAIIKDYLVYVLGELAFTRWSDDLNNMMLHAALDGDQYVANMPIDKRPLSVDPYKFREYGIVRMQYDRITHFLFLQHQEKETTMARYFRELQARLRDRRG